MRLLLATRNRHKADEFAQLLAPYGVDPLPDEVQLPPETGTTFTENALGKARAAAAATGRVVFADDSGIEAAALAKRMEEIYLPGRKAAVVLPRDSEALHLLQRIRDEAHRYALEYHRQQRALRARRSLLDDIHGVGPKRKAALLRHYGSVARIADAPLEELQALSFLDRRTAGNVFDTLHPEIAPSQPGPET